ncbi:MAG: reverse transcriptase domain-containing protein [Kiritimatiellia bacterium]
MGGCWILDVDIRKFFDTLDHQHLREILDRRIRDGVVRCLIGKWLKAGVWESGSVSYPDKGTPQGGCISPMLGNIYLHTVLDEWFENQIKPRLQGRAFLVRFADDFVIGHYAYFGITGNFRDLNRVYQQTKRIWFKWLRPRTRGKKGMTWPRFTVVESTVFTLKRPRVMHSYM